MLTIHNYSVDSVLPIEMPKGARILSVQRQHEDFCIWALVDTDMPMERRKFTKYGTGWEIDPQDMKFLTYIGTAKSRVDTFVWHFFEVKE